VAALAGAIRGNRLVTVTGIGGVGKTRLAAESLGEITAQLTMPVAVVELGAVPPGGVDAVQIR
jgi:predicted ATPase